MFLQARIMSRAGIPRAKMSILISSYKEAKQVDRQYKSKVVVEDDKLTEKGSYKEEKKNSSSSSSNCNWVPHPRSGIYFPEGQEWVMDDVPKGAASFGPTFWLRNDDIHGVDKPDPDRPHCDFH